MNEMCMDAGPGPPVPASPTVQPNRYPALSYAKTLPYVDQAK